MRKYPVLLALFGVLSLSFIISSCMASYRFDVGCGGHLKRSADANTVEMALSELNTAIQYAEANRLTSGTTAIVLPTPDEDIGFWYQNLVASRDELRRLGSDAPQLVQTNTLMKLRETLLDKTSSGESVTMPRGISLHPYELLYALWGWGSFLAMLITAGLWFWVGALRDDFRRSRW